MSMKLGLSSGSYNVRASEATRTSKPNSNKATIICSVCFLDETSVAFQINKKDKASVLLQKCFDHLDLNEKDYFSLQYNDNTPGHEMTRWVDPFKSIKKQLKGLSLKFFFRVKFYLSDPTKLRDDYTRFQFVRQLRLDILTGHLSLLYQDAVLLASYVVQSELGDYNKDDHMTGYLSSFHFVSNQTDQFMSDVCILHAQHRTQTPADSESLFLEVARVLPMYGVHLYSARLKESQGNHSNSQEIQLGVTSAGLVIFQKSIKINTFSWQKIIKITFKKKLFYIQLKKEQNENFDTHSFILYSYRTCKCLWRACVEHHTFFRLSSPPSSQKSSLFSISASRFAGKTQQQAMEENKRRPLMERSFKRASSYNYVRKSLGNPIRQLHQQTKAYMNCQNGVPGSSSYPTSLRKCADNFFQQGTTARATLPNDYKPTDYISARVTPTSTTVTSLDRTASKKKSSHQQKQPVQSYPTENGSLRRHAYSRTPTPLDTRKPREATPPAPLCSAPSAAPISSTSSPVLNTRAAANYDNRTSWFTSSCPNQDKPLETFTPATGSSTSAAGGVSMGPITPIVNHKNFNGQPTHSTPMPGHSTIDLQHPFKLTSYNDTTDSNIITNNLQMNGNDLVSIRIKPDFQGRFGFNVKGGADQSMPVIVSRVAPNTPADNCVPRLNEGDQVLYINGRDISTHTHEQVVMFIRSSKEMHSGELDLLVRPNAVYIGEESPDDQDNEDSDVLVDISRTSDHHERLEASVEKMKRAVQDGNLLSKFEQLNRRKPGMSNTISQQYINIIKNRYKDISPYDNTRVKIVSSTGDYINANYVNMEIPGSGVVNRYIAAQGPLPNTCSDFWTMVWEQQCSIVVMLTTMVERGRVKCHQYWPDLYETQCYECLHLTCVSERFTDNFAFREFTIINTSMTNPEERHIKQMQYLAWPDHAVPADSSAFLEFVSIVRVARAGLVAPIIVHCSAGIGRTGVLITMETAMCLIEANQSISTLDIVRKMREQRAMLIQTTNQFKFVCEAIIRVYEEKSVTPLDDYKN